VDDPLSKQLIAQAAIINTLRQDLDRLANDVTETIADLMAHIESIQALSAESSQRATSSWCWRDIGPAAAQELTTQLCEWVDWVRARYPLARKIPDCWAEHPETIEELTALWLAWQAAYQDPNASLTAAADWHDRWLPGFLHRLEHGAFALTCASNHQAKPPAVYAKTPTT